MVSKRRIRWDRISVAAIILVILIFLFGSCMQRCSDKEDEPTAQQDSFPTEEQIGSSTTAASTTAPTGADATLANVPVIITDADDNPASLTTTTTDSAAAAPEEPACPARSPQGHHRFRSHDGDHQHPAAKRRHGQQVHGVSAGSGARLPHAVAEGRIPDGMDRI